MSLATDPPDAAPDPAPRKLPRDARRLQLIESTVKTIAQKGFARTTMTDVAREAGLSHGLVNFHFQTKDNLLRETLLFLAEEYRLNWTAALDAAGASAPDQIAALLKADFNPAICTPDRLAAWCAFWGEAQSRPIYQQSCGSNDEQYNICLEALCLRMNAEHGYAGNPARIARALRVTVEGMWLDMMTLQAPYSLDEALATVRSVARAFYPRHFGDSPSA